MNEVEEIIQWLFEDEAKEMKKICNKYMVRFGGISKMDYDDFYSQVGWDVSVAIKNYKPNLDKSFKEFIYGVIKLSVCKQMTHRNRGKRQLIVKKEIIDVSAALAEKLLGREINESDHKNLIDSFIEKIGDGDE